MDEKMEAVTHAELTPVENRDGRLYKREDAHADLVFGVNGAKFRACRHLMERAQERGAEHVVSAASVLSPQSAMAAVLSAELGMPCTVIVGGTTPEKAVRHRSIAIAKSAGAEIRAIPVGYNPALQRAALEAAEQPGWWRLPYGITTPPDASREDVEAFLAVGGQQVKNLPDEIETLVIPFGSGNTAAGVLYGLHAMKPTALRQIVLMGIGPDRQKWVRDRLAMAGMEFEIPGVEIDHIALHPGFATYGDRMPYTLDDIVLHPTYEGKVATYLDLVSPSWWDRRDGTTCLWIVGGPI